jgi:hypothetical protein
MLLCWNQEQGRTAATRLVHFVSPLLHWYRLHCRWMALHLQSDPLMRCCTLHPLNHHCLSLSWSLHPHLMMMMQHLQEQSHEGLVRKECRHCCVLGCTLQIC